jgi:CsoR family transcriptional regulator, copper-sensing transcriptional repressor
MQHYGYYDNKDQLLKRLKRVEGQIRGIARMVETDTYCIDILTQIGAAQAALNKAGLELVRDHSKHCMSDASLTDKDRAAKADELVNAVGRLLAK